MTKKSIVFLATCTLAAALLSLIYSLTAIPQFQAQAQVTIRRATVEMPNLSNDSTKNRWIWIKDGLTTKRLLLADEFFARLARDTPHLAPGQHPAAAPENLRKLLSPYIHIDYTGGDSDTYLLQVTAPQAQLAQDLAQALVAQLKRVAISQPLATQQKVIAALTQSRDNLTKQIIRINYRRQAKLPPTDDLSAEWRDTNNLLRQLNLYYQVAAAEADARFVVVVAPQLPSQAVWPQPLLLALVAAGAGGFLGGAWLYGRKILA